jgi:hypothetical protein
MTRLRHLRFWGIASLLAATTLRCSSGGDVKPTVPTAIEKIAGDEQVGVIGLPLPNPLAVLVTDEDGNPVPGVDVGWQAQGGGSVSAQTAKTDSDGRASVQRVLGTNPGQQTTIATASGLQGSPLTFISTAAQAGEPASIAITTNPPVTALTEEVFDPAVQPVVQVKDGSGAPAGGVQVTAHLAGASGTLQGSATATTDANGVAKFADLGIGGPGSYSLQFTAGAANVTSSTVEITPLPQEATIGKWGPVVPWDIVPLHISLLPNGKIFAWGKREIGDTMGMPRIWDPASGPPNGLPEIRVTDMLFCAGHTLMPDGRLMVSGGHHMDDAGINTTYFFSQDGAPQKAASMAFGRWYPTVTVLPDGRVLTMAGRDAAGAIVTTPEIWEGDHWTQLPGAGAYKVPYYPRNFVPPNGPNGRIFMAGERIVSRWFDVDGSDVGGRGRWTVGPAHVNKINRDFGTAVMYEPGKILYAGGGGFPGWRVQSDDPSPDVPTATAEIIDLNQPSPQWQNIAPMSGPRRHLNSTILPDGTVLITGGTRGGGVLVDFSDANSMRAAEIWNPRTLQWTPPLASNNVTRVYHSVSLLLPDGTVLHGGSGDAGEGTGTIPPQRSHEIFSPPYLFKGARPTITSAPPTVGYNQVFSITTPNAAQITDVRWIRLGSVTHAFDMGQRANTLSFSKTATSVDVTAPANPNLAPPGYYQLFVLNRNGVPSAGKIIRIQ